MTKPAQTITVAPSTLEVFIVRVELLKRGWRRQDLARRCGFSSGGLGNQLSRGVPSRMCRHKIEAAFGYSVPVWSTRAFLARRKGCVAALGFDPCLLRLRELRAWVHRLELRPFFDERSKAKVISAILSHVALNPRLKKETNE